MCFMYNDRGLLAPGRGGLNKKITRKNNVQNALLAFFSL